jgi:hypothetical protein
MGIGAISGHPCHRVGLRRQCHLQARGRQRPAREQLQERWHQRRGSQGQARQGPGAMEKFGYSNAQSASAIADDHRYGQRGARRWPQWASPPTSPRTATWTSTRPATCCPRRWPAHDAPSGWASPSPSRCRRSKTPPSRGDRDHGDSAGSLQGLCQRCRQHLRRQDGGSQGQGDGLRRQHRLQACADCPQACERGAKGRQMADEAQGSPDRPICRHRHHRLGRPDRVRRRHVRCSCGDLGRDGGRSSSSSASSACLRSASCTPGSTSAGSAPPSRRRGMEFR